VDWDRRITRRGHEISLIHYVKVEGEPTDGRYFEMNGFPDNVPEPGVISHHVGFIVVAAAQFEADRSQELSEREM
jgi:hypothetical protein